MGLGNSASHYSDQNMMNFLETFYFIHQIGYFIVVGSGKLLVTPSYSVDKGCLKDLEIAGLYKDLRLKGELYSKLILIRMKGDPKAN